jgi:hypothetical protein
MEKMTEYKVPKAPRISRFKRGKTYTVDEIRKADGYHRESYLLMLVSMLLKLEKNAEAYYATMGYQRDYETKRGVTFGDKWDKVWVMRDGKKARIVCHIDADTGIIYKSNSAKGAPYPKPRADIFIPESYEYADPHGGWLYANFKADQPRYGDASVKKTIEEGLAIMNSE